MAQTSRYPLLDQVRNPGDLRVMDEASLPQLAEELRAFLIESVGRTGGHLAAGLGVVELTVALHYVFDTPRDRLVWDTGHQCYPHKILTERRSRMDTLRRQGGISGFPKRTESPYDSFGVGHSSTSLSAALGMTLGAAARGEARKVVAVIGDGAMTAGMAFEALNQAGAARADLLVILNDNRMSISPNVGALSHYLGRILSSRFYSNVREGSKRVLSAVPSLRELARRAEEHFKGMVVPGTLFEELGFNYIGPIDGHDLPTLLRALRNVKELGGPQLLHIVTQKGKGYSPAETDPCAYHGVTAFDPRTGRMQGRSHGGSPTYTEVFGRWICDMAERDPRLVAITPAMREGSGLVQFSELYPDRFFDVDIAEQHAVTFAAGLACEGMKPVVAIYSTFLQRAYDQVVHDVALQKLPVLFAIDRGGLVGADGPTHAGSFDLSFLGCIPDLTLMVPADENECRQMLYTGFLLDGPAAVRYPRATGPGAEVRSEMAALALGKAEVRRRGRRVAILAFGSPVAAAHVAAERLDATLVNMRFVKPLDRAMVLDLAASHELLVTVEENALLGGAGSAVANALSRFEILCPVLNLGLPDHFVEHGDRQALLAQAGLDADGIAAAIEERLKDTTCQVRPMPVKFE